MGPCWDVETACDDERNVQRPTFNVQRSIRPRTRPMISLNHILLFIACFSPLVMLGQTLRRQWSDLVGWVRSDVPAAIRRNDFALMPLYLRALGECGMRDELVLEFGTMLAVISPSQQPAWSYQASLCAVLAFCGRLGARA